MSKRVAPIALFAILAAGCGGGPPAGLPPGLKEIDNHPTFAQSVFGSVRQSVTLNLCAGRVTLAQGSASVADSCFTGDTNVVLCTDVTAPNAVRCAPGKGALLVMGTGQDVVSYARVK